MSESPTIQIVGTTDFASRTGQGSILAACYAPAPCRVRVAISVGGAPIAKPKRESLGADELGYLNFQLNPAGRAMLNHAPGNQLGVQVRLSRGRDVATGQIALVRYR